jgi:hypothetical protein
MSGCGAGVVTRLRCAVSVAQHMHACMLHACVVYSRVRRRSCGVVLSIDTGRERVGRGTEEGVLRLRILSWESRITEGWRGGEEGMYIYPCSSILWLVII